MIHLVGSSGFIGREIRQAMATDKICCWDRSKNHSSNLYFNLDDRCSWNKLLSCDPSVVVLLAWPNLSDYNNKSHITKTLPAYIQLVESLAVAGCKHMIFAGTCYEYGMLNGSLSELDVANPVNDYGIAKDVLRKISHRLCVHHNIRWTWLRIFYPYGIHQNPKSLYPSLVSAIANNKDYFAMSSGIQIRDFLPVENVALVFKHIIKSSHEYGILNVGSGNPISLRNFVEQCIQKSTSSIRLKLGVYPDRSDEPLAFWANMDKYKTLGLPGEFLAQK